MERKKHGEYEDIQHTDATMGVGANSTGTLSDAKGDKKKWVIKDWAGNLPFGYRKFSSFEDADEFLTGFIEKKYPKTKNDEDEYATERGEYEIAPDKGSRDARYLDPKDPRSGQKSESEVKAKHPPMTVKEIRELLQSGVSKEKAKEAFDSLSKWYLDNQYKITVGEAAAFSRYIGNLHKVATGEKSESEVNEKDETKEILIALNSSGGMGMKYPIGNKELTAKVKDLENAGKISYDQHFDKWIKGKRKNESEDDEVQPDNDDILLSSTGPLGAQTQVSAGGRSIGVFSSHDEAVDAAKEWCKKQNFYPNVWIVSDHGNYHQTTLGESASKPKVKVSHSNKEYAVVASITIDGKKYEYGSDKDAKDAVSGLRGELKDAGIPDEDIDISDWFYKKEESVSVIAKKALTESLDSMAKIFAKHGVCEDVLVEWSYKFKSKEDQKKQVTSFIKDMMNSRIENDINSGDFDPEFIGDTVEDQLTGLHGEVNGKETEDVFKDLTKGMSEKEINYCADDVDGVVEIRGGWAYYNGRHYKDAVAKGTNEDLMDNPSGQCEITDNKDTYKVYVGDLNDANEMEYLFDVDIPSKKMACEYAYKKYKNGARDVLIKHGGKELNWSSLMKNGSYSELTNEDADAPVAEFDIYLDDKLTPQDVADIERGIASKYSVDVDANNEFKLVTLLNVTKAEIEKILADLGSRAVSPPETSNESKMNENKEWSEEAIIDDLTKEFGEDHREEIKDSLEFPGGRYKSFSDNTGKFEADGQEYNFFLSEEEAEKVAIESVEQDAESEPEIFSKDFMSQHIYISDTDKRIISTEEAEALADGEDFESDKEKEEWIEEKSDEIEKQLDDPIQYFVHDQGIYTEAELLKTSFIQIDTKELAKDAVNIDGWAHFLSHYDGKYEVTSGGLVYVRE